MHITKVVIGLLPLALLAAAAPIPSPDIDQDANVANLHELERLIKQYSASLQLDKRQLGLSTAGFTSDISEAQKQYMQAQKDMFAAQMKQQNQMQVQTTEQEFAQKMNDAAWKAASGAAGGKIQRKQRRNAQAGSRSASPQSLQEQQELLKLLMELLQMQRSGGA